LRTRYDTEITIVPSDIEREIPAAQESLRGLVDVRICGEVEAADVVGRVRALFVHGNPSAWWHALKGTAVVHDYADGSGLLPLEDHLRSSEGSCWLVIDDGTEQFCLELPVLAVGEFLKQLRFVEYYVVSKDLDWMLCENEHNQIIVVTL
jgi:hypothetical protein